MTAEPDRTDPGTPLATPDDAAPSDPVPSDAAHGTTAPDDATGATAGAGSGSGGPDSAAEPALDPNRSGLRDPQRAISGLGALILGLEALVILLTIVPLRMLRVDPLGPTIGVMVVLTVACIALAGLMRRGVWAWHGGSAVQVVLLLGGFVHWALAGVGVIFGLTWCYAWSVRARLSKPPVREGLQ